MSNFVFGIFIPTFVAFSAVIDERE